MSAAFILQGWHLRDDAVRATLTDYDLIVCNPSLDPVEIGERLDATGGPFPTLLAYYHAHTIPAYGEGNTFYIGLRNAMEAHLLRYPGSEESIIHPGANAYELQLSFDAHEDYAKWIVDHLDGWDGVYLDEAWDIPDQRWVERCGRDRMDTQVRWAALLEYFRYRLGAESIAAGLDGHVTVVANIGPPNPYAKEPNRRLWDAITIEKNHIEADRAAAARAFSESRKPDLNVAWWSDLSFPGLVMPGIRLPESGEET